MLYTIGEEDDQDRSRKDLVLGLAKAVANSTAALVLKAKNVASECEHYNQNRVSLKILKVCQNKQTLRSSVLRPAFTAYPIS